MKKLILCSTLTLMSISIYAVPILETVKSNKCLIGCGSPSDKFISSFKINEVNPRNKSNIESTNKKCLNKTNVLEDPSNLNNPYDYIGYLHNKGIDYMFSHSIEFYNPVSNAINKNNFKESFSNYYANYAGNFLDSIYNTSNNVDSLKSASLKFFTDEINFSSLMASISDSLSPSQLNYYNSVLTTINNFSDFSTFKTQVVSIESSIINSNLSTNEKLVLLMGTSVARYSAHYWSSTSLEEIRSNLNDLDFPSIAIVDILKSDFQGAIAGGFYGLMKGLNSGALVFGPGGVVLTAVGGAVVGSIVGSFGDLLWELFWAGMDWLFG